MNKRGQMIIVGAMMAFFLFIAVVVMVEPLKEITSIGRDDADCTNESLSTGEEMTCIILDSYMPLYLGFAIAVAIGYLAVREKFGPPSSFG